MGGIVVQLKENGDVVVSGTATHAGISEAPDVQAGDHLLGVDGRAMHVLPLSAVLSSLSGHTGAIERLLVLRAGRRLVVRARVQTRPRS